MTDKNIQNKTDAKTSAESASTTSVETSSASIEISASAVSTSGELSALAVSSVPAASSTLTSANLKVSAKIRAIREYFELTFNEFGRSVGFAGCSIKRFENRDLRARKGEEGLDHPVIAKICDVYGMDRRYFYGELELDKAISSEKADKYGERSRYGEREDKGIIERLRTARKKKGYGVVELNALVGLSSGHLSKIEHGDIVLTSQTAEKIADALDIGVEWLLKGDEEKKDYPISEKLIVWLWKNPELRKELWEKYRKKYREENDRQ